MKISPIKRKLNLIDEISQIENTKSKANNHTTSQPNPQSGSGQEWFDALHSQLPTEITPR